MRPPPPLPQSESQLAAWHVYADELLSRGHRVGELVAYELALPTQPGREALAAFQALAVRACHASRRLEVGWCLGHARTVAVRHDYRSLSGHGVQWIPEGALVAARDFLASPVGQTVEQFATHLPLDTARADPWWRRVMAALPSRCAEVRLGLPDAFGQEAATDVLAGLPPGVKTLGLWRPGRSRVELQPHWFVDDRLEWLDLIWWAPTPEGLSALFDALARTRRVRVRLPSSSAPPVALAARLSVGETGFLADHGRPCAVPPWQLRMLQRHHGIVTWHAQLHRLLPERYDLDHPAAGRLAASYREGTVLVRHGNGRWSARSTHSLPLKKNDLTLAPGALPVSLDHGDEVRIGADPTLWRFYASGLDGAFHRAALAVTSAPTREPRAAARG